MANMDEDQLLDYEEEQEEATDTTKAENGTAAEKKIKGTYASIHSSGFRDFLLKPELLRAIVDCGFEHPSEVQHECIPQAILGMDIVCQAKSGMGKTAVFVLATLQQLEPVDGEVSVLVMCHTRELAFQISKEYERFSKYYPGIKIGVFFGGMPIKKDEELLKNNTPHIVVDMRRDVQEIVKMTPQEKQVMMFSATLPKDLRAVCKKFMQDVRFSNNSTHHIQSQSIITAVVITAAIISYHYQYYYCYYATAIYAAHCIIITSYCRRRHTVPVT
ncbi:unnamed protein product [Anisakis simplex]|uniref:RNA helicase n=1 Tax=Anisakis simplex TaxID=6269 RepID=A0A0M3KF16_ANISI|nr:unnamed protein product [Anisakis simplex]